MLLAYIELISNCGTFTEGRGTQAGGSRRGRGHGAVAPIFRPRDACAESQSIERPSALEGRGRGAAGTRACVPRWCQPRGLALLIDFHGKSQGKPLLRRWDFEDFRFKVLTEHEIDMNDIVIV